MLKRLLRERTIYKVIDIQVREKSTSTTTQTNNSKTAKITQKRPSKSFQQDQLPKEITVSNEEAMRMYKQMLIYRKTETAIDQQYKQRNVRGFCHLYDGQEAALAGLSEVKQPQDSMITSYRAHCHYLLSGGDLRSLVAELCGKSTGCSEGYGGSMHIYNVPGRFYGGNGIVGAQIPLGTGLGFAHQYTQDNGVALTFFGDGAANQGQLFEAINMAKLWSLPVVYICENNRYAMGTSVDRSTLDREFYKRFAMSGLWVDGLDAIACKQGFKFALDWCRNGNGPIVVELDTYRYHGHSMSDPGVSYRTRDEVNDMRKNSDCIVMLQRQMISNNFCTEDELDKLSDSIRDEVNQQVELAKKDPEPELTKIYEHIYSTPVPYVRMPLTNRVICPRQ